MRAPRKNILGRLRARLAQAGALARAAFDTEHLNFSAAIPGGTGGAPLWRLDVQTLTEPQADGEKLRLRAHIQTNFASVLRESLDRPPPPEHEALSAGDAAPSRAERVGRLAQRAAGRALSVPLLRGLAQPLLDHDFHTWIELQASTASLDQGAKDLMPAREALARLGIEPVMSRDAPVAQTWAGESPRGLAQVSVLQMDKRHLPPRLAKAIGDRPFSLAAAIVNVAEQKRK